LGPADTGLTSVARRRAAAASEGHVAQAAHEVLAIGNAVDAVVAGAAFGALLPQAPTRTPASRTTIADARAFGHVSRPLAPISFIGLPRIEGSACSDAVGP